MRKADDDEFLDAGGQGDVYKVPGIKCVGLGKELLRTRREQDTGEVDDTVGVLAGFNECREIGEISAMDSDIGVRRDISGRFVVVDEKVEVVLGFDGAISLDEVPSQMRAEVAGSAGDEDVHSSAADT